MPRVRHLANAVAASATLLTVLWWGLVGLTGLLGFPAGRPSAELSPGQLAGLATVILGPAVLSAWWLFRRLATLYNRREARAAAFAFALASPPAMAISAPLAIFPGAYLNRVLEPRVFGLVGAFIGTVAMVSLLTFLACTGALWLARRTEKPDAEAPSAEA